MKYYSYEAFREDICVLAKEVRPFATDTIVAIARGGMSTAQALAHALGIRNVQSVSTKLYDETRKRDTMEIVAHCDLSQSKRVLIVDDIADSGETLQEVLQLLKKRYPKIAFKSATLFYKTTAIIHPDYTVQEAKDWIEFFWERDFRLEDV